MHYITQIINEKLNLYTHTAAKQKDKHSNLNL